MSNREEGTLEEGLLANDQIAEETLTQEDEDKIRRDKLWKLRWPVFALCVAVLTQVYMLISCFAYVPLMCIFLVPGLNEQNAGSYAGFISAMFMIGRTTTSTLWGSAADKFGRIWVFQVSYVLSIIFTLIFGTSQNIWVALISRFLLGASNGIVSAVKTVASELSEGEKKLESDVMGWAFSMRGYGFLASPAIAGFISDPVKQFPNSYVATHFTAFLTKYPYILPNLVGVFICIVGMITTWLYIPETRPETIARRQARGQSNITMKQIWANENCRDHLITYWTSVFCSQWNLETLPLFFIATNGGLALQEATIGSVLGGAGLVYLILYMGYFEVYNRLGTWNTMKFCSLVGSNLAVLTPIALYLNAGVAPNHLTAGAFFFLIFVQGILRFGVGVMYTVSSMGCNHSVSRDELSAMNGLSMFGASFTQAFGPIGAGLTTSFALSSGIIDPEYGAFLPFGICSAIAIFLSFWIFIKLKKHYTPATESV